MISIDNNILLTAYLYTYYIGGQNYQVYKNNDEQAVITDYILGYKNVCLLMSAWYADIFMVEGCFEPDQRLYWVGEICWDAFHSGRDDRQSRGCSRKAMLSHRSLTPLSSYCIERKPISMIIIALSQL